MLFESWNHTLLILGSGGQGKTYFAKRLLLNLKARGYPYFVIDPVGQYGSAWGKVYRSRDALRGEIPSQAIFSWGSVEDFDAMSYWLYRYSVERSKAKRLYVIIEEAQISLGQKKTHPLIDLVISARGNNCYLVIINRALCGLSSLLFESATCFILFRTKSELTLTRLKRLYSIDPERIARLDDHEKLIYKV